MTILIKGHTVLKSSKVIQSGDTLYRYRLTVDHNNDFGVHVETRGIASFSIGEQFLYKGNNLVKANAIFLKQSIDNNTI